MKLHPFDGTRHPAFTLALMLARVLAATSALAWAIQEPLIFPGVLCRRSTPEARAARARDAGADEVVLRGDDGAEVVLWRFPADGERVALFFHGNAMTLEDGLTWWKPYREHGFDLVAVELRGFDGVPGWPTEAHAVADAQVAWRWVTGELGVPPERVVLHGESLGGGVAAALGAAVRPGGIVLVSTFDSLEAVAAEKLWYVPVRWLIRSPFPSAERLAGTRVPTFVTHARDDRVVPFPHGEALARSIPDATWVPVDTGDHAALTLIDPVARAAWSAWLDRTFPR